MRICSHCGHHNELEVVGCVSCGREPERVEDATLGDIARDPSFLIGKVLDGKYEVRRVLGEGGMGVVYQVRHLLLKHRNLFALKILHPKFSTDSSFRERFLREVEVAMELTHENIVAIRDFGVTSHGLLFFTMDYFPGETLKDVLRRDGPFSPARASTVAHAVLRALGEAHRCGVVHRDLKPDNILISAPSGGDEVRILDFGIAKLVEDGAPGSITLTEGTVIGTPKYMSPEQAEGKLVDVRSDLYSLGVVLYELLMGRVPFGGKTLRQIVMGHLSTPPPPFDRIGPELDVPPELERVVLRMLEKERVKRPSSAQECADLFTDVGTLDAEEKASARTRRRGGGKRLARGRRVMSVGALVLLLVASSALLVWQSPFAAKAERASSAPTWSGARPPRTVSTAPEPEPEPEPEPHSVTRTATGPGSGKAQDRTPDAVSPGLSHRGRSSRSPHSRHGFPEAREEIRRPVEAGEHRPRGSCGGCGRVFVARSLSGGRCPVCSLELRVEPGR